MHKRFAALAAPLLYLACASAQADTMRCGSALVSVGDRAFEVQQKCGDPDHRDDVGYTLGADSTPFGHSAHADPDTCSTLIRTG
ncbi:DUF2845 domain-containing protein, partial [Pseudomonas aeruginosa]|uniref:DUF2845 domain-containing protein n=1 Tax=Pseudomonas aeruginosa TaxID=287 RepID=UPI00402B32AF